VVGGFASSGYWSSTVFDDYGAWLQDFYYGAQNYGVKYSTFYVRAIRAF
jgi:hypothetical protein